MGIWILCLSASRMRAPVNASYSIRFPFSLSCKVEGLIPPESLAISKISFSLSAPSRISWDFATWLISLNKCLHNWIFPGSSNIFPTVNCVIAETILKIQFHANLRHTLWWISSQTIHLIFDVSNRDWSHRSLVDISPLFSPMKIFPGPPWITPGCITSAFMPQKPLTTCSSPKALTSLG